MEGDDGIGGVEGAVLDRETGAEPTEPRKNRDVDAQVTAVPGIDDRVAPIGCTGGGGR